jgi:ketosteroid isomerase-like protein
MKRHLLFALALCAAPGLPPTSAAQPALPAASREIATLLSDQSAAWNRGDIEAFMQGYAQTDQLRFASGGTITRGWRPTLERYKQRYTDKMAMGTLAFTDLEVTELSPDTAIAFGRWKLTRATDAPHGLFTLTMKKTVSGWRIIQDHTSSVQ